MTTDQPATATDPAAVLNRLTRADLRLLDAVARHRVHTTEQGRAFMAIGRGTKAQVNRISRDRLEGHGLVEPAPVGEWGITTLGVRVLEASRG